MTLVKVAGKSKTARGRFVPVLLSNNMNLAVDTLMTNRSKVGICPQNPYVFANREEKYIRGHDCLRNMSHPAGCQFPERINSTSLRKYVATVIQLFDLQEVHVDLIARHLGHDLRVHRDFYRLQEHAQETSLVSKLLLAINSGKASALRGKTLENMEETLKGMAKTGKYTYSSFTF